MKNILKLSERFMNYVKGNDKQEKEFNETKCAIHQHATLQQDNNTLRRRNSNLIAVCLDNHKEILRLQKLLESYDLKDMAFRFWDEEAQKIIEKTKPESPHLKNTEERKYTEEDLRKSFESGGYKNSYGFPVFPTFEDYKKD